MTGGGNGANATRYALSGGVFNQEGVVINSGIQAHLAARKSRSDRSASKLPLASTSPSDRVNSSSVPTDGSLNAGAGAVGAAIDYYPILPVSPAERFVHADGTEQPVGGARRPTNIPNPVSMAADVTDKLDDTRVLANAFGEYESHARPQASHEPRHRSLEPRRATRTIPARRCRARRRTARRSAARRQTTNFLNENTLSYNRVVRHRPPDRRRRRIHPAAERSRSKPDLRTAISSATSTSSRSSASARRPAARRSARRTHVGRSPRTSAAVNYTLANRYLFTVTGREDGSSRFGADHQWGFFPSGAVGWRVSDEPFMSKYPASRAAQAARLVRSRRQPVDPAVSVDGAPALDSSTRSAARSSRATTLPSVGNPNLSWETTRQTRPRRSTWISSADASASPATSIERRLGPAARGQSSVRSRLRARRSRTRARSGTTATSSGSRSPFSTTSAQRRSAGRRRSTTRATRTTVLDLGGVSQIFAIEREQRSQALRVVDPSRPAARRVLWISGRRPASATRRSAAAYTAAVKPISGTSWKPGDVEAARHRRTDGRASDSRHRPGRHDQRRRPHDHRRSESKVRRRLDEHVQLQVAFDCQLAAGRRFRQQDPEPEQRSARGRAVRRTNIIADRYLDAWTPTNTDARVSAHQLHARNDRLRHHQRSARGRLVPAPSHVTLDVALPDRLVVALRRSPTRGSTSPASNLVTWTHYSGFNPDVSSLGIGNVNRGIDVGQYPLAKSFTLGINLTY